MSFARPTLAALRSRIAGDMSARLLDGAPLPSRSVLSVLSWVHAGACHLMYGALQWYFRQFWAVSAERDWLEMKASTWGIARKPGARASGRVTFSGSGTVAAGQVLRSASGLIFTLDADVEVNGTGTGTITAAELGKDGNLAQGAQLTLVSPAAGISGTASAANAFSGGTDEEDDDALRDRLLAALRNPPRGGSRADYEQWATSVEGCTRAWAKAETGQSGSLTGSVAVCVVDDDLDDPTDCASVVAAVQEYIDGVRPITARAWVYAPVPEAVNLSVTLTPNTAAVRTAVKAELADLFVREGEPDKALPVSHITEAISVSAGETDHVVTAISTKVRGASAVDRTGQTVLTPTAGCIFTLGTVTFSSAG